MVVAYRYDTIQLSTSIVIALSQRLHGFGKVFLEPSLKLNICVLARAGTDHDEQTSPLDAERLVCDSVFPPGLVLFEKIWGVDDVVMIVDIVEEVLHERV
jgi:hypothetical protein